MILKKTYNFGSPDEREDKPQTWPTAFYSSKKQILVVSGTDNDSTYRIYLTPKETAHLLFTIKQAEEYRGIHEDRLQQVAEAADANQDG